MNAHELLVRIRAIFSREGETNLAKPVEDLSKAQAATAKSTEDTVKQTTDLKKKTEDLGETAKKEHQETDAAETARKEHIENAAWTMRSLRESLEGNIGGMSRLYKEWKLGTQAAKEATTGVVSFKVALEQAGGALGLITAVGGAAWVGWNAGLKAQEYLWNKFVENINSTPAFMAKTKESFEKLDQVKLEQLQKELDGINRTLDITVQNLDAAKRQASELRGAQAQLQDAIIKAQVRDPEQQKKALARAASDRTQTDLKTEQDATQAKINAISTAQAEKKKLLEDDKGARAEIELAKAQEESAIEIGKRRRANGQDSTVQGTLAQEARNRMEAAQAKLKPKVTELEDSVRSMDREISELRTHLAATEAKLATAKLEDPRNIFPNTADATAVFKKIGGYVTDDTQDKKDRERGSVVGALVDRKTLAENDIRSVDQFEKSGLYPSDDAFKAAQAKAQRDYGLVVNALDRLNSTDHDVQDRILEFLENLSKKNQKLEDQIRRLPL